ncbi:CRISPR-associated protein Cas2 [Alicyclobacillus sp. SO9]|uniref:CRISPR-associated protein Cas2 n=1 Tax=Alicyclobacillus sp. SO9 TaxID=2665646 RepID=UPI0018E71EA2|nr:CRISPR-associated protein Cas2 [Alicyclobacillus sp. SO9]QQE78090.1 CRISPR-associated protein Cas2 [Alicyclobacillus sp. SO9]
MNVLIVAYDLHEKPESAYETLISGIRQYSNTFEFQKSVWIIATERERANVRDYLKQFIQSDDKLFVGTLTNGSWTGGQTELTNFLSNYWTIE